MVPSPQSTIRVMNGVGDHVSVGAEVSVTVTLVYVAHAADRSTLYAAPSGAASSLAARAGSWTVRWLCAASSSVTVGACRASASLKVNVAKPVTVHATGST